MRTFRFTYATAALLLVAALVFQGCFGGDPAAKSKVEEAVTIIGSSRTLLEDLVELDGRFNTLGTRYPNMEDTIAEGKSLIEMTVIDLDELESRYGTARDLLFEVAAMEGAGNYGEYAELVLESVDTALRAFELNRELLMAVSDMLDVMALAESEEQLSFYVEEIDRLSREVSRELEAAAEAAAEADRYYEERGL